jgi:hypothetical protein
VQNNASADHREKLTEEFSQCIKSATDNTINFRFEEAQLNLEQMATVIGQMPEEEQAVANDFLSYVRDFVEGNRLLQFASSNDDREAALGHLTHAKQTLRRMRTNKEMAGSAGLIPTVLGIEGQIRGVQMRLARDRGDTKELERLAAQAEAGLNDLIKSIPPEESEHWFLRGCKAMQEALPKFLASVRAAAEMNLDLAEQYLRDASSSFEQMKENFDRAGSEAAMAQSAARCGKGFDLIARSLGSYVNVLRAAIVGDITKSDVDALAEAERNVLDGAVEIAKATAAAPGFFAGLDMQPYAAQLSTLTRNLRALGQRSLSPKAISRSASPRAVIYFVIVFAVLLFALPASGLVQKINFLDVVFLIVISAVISLISAFGFESIRLIPWFDVLARFSPGGSKAPSPKKNSKSEE